MKGRILELLKETKGVISGEALSAELGVSRVSIWKHIRSLQECGYEIQSTAKGYRLMRSPDTPFPWEFPGWQSRIHYLEETPSTMDDARTLARKGCPHLTVVVAGRQTKGRGRLQRMWRSKAGGLYFTMVLRPRIEPALSGRINFYAAAILAKILRESYGVTAAVKWPNDILVAEKKLAGLLAEMEADSDRVNHINIGCGININNTPKTEEPGAVSLKQLIGRRVSRREVLAAFLNAFENEFDHSADVSVIDMWKSYNVTLNRQVKVVTIREELEGLAVDVDTNGALILKQEDGSLKTVFYGDCFHHRTR